MSVRPSATINNCPYCDAYTLQGSLPHLCSKQRKIDLENHVASGPPSYEKLRSLRDRVAAMTGTNDDEMLLTWALSTIDRLYDLDEPLIGPDR